VCLLGIHAAFFATQPAADRGADWVQLVRRGPWLLAIWAVGRLVSNDGQTSDMSPDQTRHQSGTFKLEPTDQGRSASTTEGSETLARRNPELTAVRWLWSSRPSPRSLWQRLRFGR
jgi:hypothetical protein